SRCARTGDQRVCPKVQRNRRRGGGRRSRQTFKSLVAGSQETTRALLRCLPRCIANASVVLTFTAPVIARGRQTERLVWPAPQEPFRAAVDIANVHAFVHAANGDDVTLQPDGDTCLVVTCGRARCDFLALSVDEFPVFQRGEQPVEFDIDPAKFLAALRAVEPSMSDEMTTRYYECGAFLEHAQRLITTDGKRIGTFAFADAVPSPAPPDCIVPLAAVRRLLPLLRDTSELRLGVSPTVFTATAPGGVLRTKTIDGEFPA